MTKKELLEKTADNFMKFCHAPDCLFITECPKLCSCRKHRKFRLDYNTALLWKISRAIINILYYESLKPHLKNLYSNLYFSLGIFEHHSNKYWVHFIEKFMINLDHYYGNYHNNDTKTADNIHIRDTYELFNDLNNLKKYQPKRSIIERIKARRS